MHCTLPTFMSHWQERPFCMPEQAVVGGWYPYIQGSCALSTQLMYMWVHEIHKMWNAGVHVNRAVYMYMYMHMYVHVSFWLVRGAYTVHVCVANASHTWYKTVQEGIDVCQPKVDVNRRQFPQQLWELTVSILLTNFSLLSTTSSTLAQRAKELIFTFQVLYGMNKSHSGRLRPLQHQTAPIPHNFQGVIGEFHCALAPKSWWWWRWKRGGGISPSNYSDFLFCFENEATQWSGPTPEVFVEGGKDTGIVRSLSVGGGAVLRGGVVAWHMHIGVFNTNRCTT